MTEQQVKVFDIIDYGSSLQEEIDRVEATELPTNTGE